MNERVPDSVLGTQAQLMMRWMQEFIAKPHDDLGRDGPVCPVVPPAMKHGKFELTSSYIEPTYENFLALLETERDSFLAALSSEHDQPELLCRMIAMEGCSTEAHAKLMDEAQAAMKPGYMKKGLMVGQLHPFNETPGLYSETFRPFKTDGGFAFTVRPMIAPDYRFIRQNLSSPVAIHEATQAYLARFMHLISDDVRKKLEAL